MRKIFYVSPKLIIPEHNLGKTRIPGYPTWVHMHTQSLGNCILLAMAQKSITSTSVKTNKQTKQHHQKSTNQPQLPSKRNKQATWFDNHVSWEYCVWSCIGSFKSSLSTLDSLFPYECKLKACFSIMNVRIYCWKIQLKYMLQKLKLGVNGAWISVPWVTHHDTYSVFWLALNSWKGKSHKHGTTHQLQIPRYWVFSSMN